MANRCSALAAYYPTGLHGRPGEPGVKLQEIPDLNLWQIAGWQTRWNRSIWQSPRA